MGHFVSSIWQVLQFVLLILFTIALLEAHLYSHLKYWDRKWFVPAMLSSVPTAGILFLMLLGREFSLQNMLPVFVSILFVEVFLIGFFKIYVRGRYSLPIMLLSPALIGLGLLIVYPLVFEVYLAFHDLKLTTMNEWRQHGTLPFIGLKNFFNVFRSSPLSEISFFQLLFRTIWWTFINVFFHVTGGFILALLMNNRIKFRGIYRTLIVIPWAMPQVVAVLALRGEFHSQYGFINIMIEHLTRALPFLTGLGVQPVQWLSNHAFLTCILINIWLGIPFMMVIILGGLQSISRHYYDAASIDGASRLQKLRYITIPMIKPVLGPAITLGTIWTFNNINVIYLVTGQAGGTEEADILVSALYKSAFTYYRYSYSAAFAIIIFAILFIISMIWLKWTKSTESVYG